MKRVSLILLVVVGLFTCAGCAHLAEGLAVVTENPAVEQVVTGLGDLFGGVPYVGTILGFLGWGVQLAKKKKQDTKLVAISSGVQKAINSIKDKDVVEAVKELLRHEAEIRGVAEDINKELAYLRSKGLIPADKSGT